MAIHLYRKGTTHEIKGVLCELRSFEAHELESCLRAGWVVDAAHLDPDDKKLLLKLITEKEGIIEEHQKKLDSYMKKLYGIVEAEKADQVKEEAKSKAIKSEKEEAQLNKEIAAEEAKKAKKGK